MILAVSRFKVANGMEGQVRQAFVDRPHMVDTVPGFLGMETFTDREDRAIFHLVTRWTDSSSFHRWHHSHAHQHSHRLIPKGLKLDRTQTRLIELERIDAMDSGGRLGTLTADAAPLLAAFLRESASTVLLAAAPDGTILTSTAAFAASLQRPADQIAGSSVWDCLVAADADRIRTAVTCGKRKPAESVLLNFVAGDGVPFSMICRLDVQPDGFVIVGEPPARQEAQLRDQLLQLNNELATVSRENVRKTRELEKALVQLKEAQAMLVQQEKMASLGQMTAGVAHEINNPIAFVASNHETLLRDIQGLLTLINVVGDSLEEIGAAVPAAQDRILHKAAAIDLRGLVESIPRRFADNIEGLDRVKQIVLDLRSFSRLDEASFKTADVNEGVTSTVRFLGPLLAEHQVSVTTELADLPPLWCSPATLNQAFSNVFANAIQASPRGGVIDVSTSLDGGRCVVRIADRGAGIAPDVLTKVFDPFFTTKPVGSGTGLGLHIARQIVTAHHGDVAIASRCGEGTTVTISIPIASENGPAGGQTDMTGAVR